MKYLAASLALLAASCLHTPPTTIPDTTTPESVAQAPRQVTMTVSLTAPPDMTTEDLYVHLLARLRRGPEPIVVTTLTHHQEVTP
jgi:hypothetical protein